MAVLDEAADLSINAVWTLCYDYRIRLWNERQGNGVRLKHWIAQLDRRPMEEEIMA
jgi:hypothetical protein